MTDHNTASSRPSGWQPTIARPDPPPAVLDDPVFEAVWQCIKTWDINVPGAYVGYMGATGNHAWAIVDVVARTIIDKLAGSDPPAPAPRWKRTAARAFAEALGFDADTGELLTPPAPEIEGLKRLKAQAEGIRRYIDGEQLCASSDITESTSYGYGDLDNHGFWQYPVPSALVELVESLREKKEQAEAEVRQLKENQQCADERQAALTHDLLAAEADVTRWQEAALAKPSVWKAIQGRLCAGESPEALAEDYAVPVRWVQFLALPECDVSARGDTDVTRASHVDLAARDVSGGDVYQLRDYCLWQCFVRDDTGLTWRPIIPDIRTALSSLPSLRGAAEKPQEYTEAHGLVRNLLARLPFPDALPAPEIVMEDDGDLGFDWDVSRDVSVTASLSPSGRIAWAALIGDWKAHGHFELPSWSPEFNDAMTQLGEAGRGAAEPDGGVAETERRHSANCRAGEAQSQREADALQAGFELGRAAEPEQPHTLYQELLYAVGNKYPGESRHQTALRYIRQAEQHVGGPASSTRGEAARVPAPPQPKTKGPQ